MATQKNLDLYDNKVLAVKFIISSTRQGTDDKVAIKRASAKFGISEHSAKAAWLTYQETAGRLVDYRFPNGRPKLTQKHYNKLHDDIVEIDDTYVAGEIIKEFLTTTITISELCSKHKISEKTYYKWIYEMNTKGTLLGRTIFDYTKYSKKNIKDVIIYCKPKQTGKRYPKVKNINTDYAEYLGRVLKQYLTKRAVVKKAKATAK